MDAYPQVRSEPYRGDHPIQGTLRSLVDTISESAPLAARPDVQVKGSAGLGNWAAVPWIPFWIGGSPRPPERRVSGAPFREDMSGLYLHSHGHSAPQATGPRIHARAAERQRKSGTWLGDPELVTRGFKADSEIRPWRGSLARDYAASTIVHKFYARDTIPDDAQILQDLDAVLDLSDTDIAHGTA